ncbi:ArnT family glycosyltransferase [Geodermatophilus sp. CPCC 205761]|uniref:ArnT family glycosyltransferase n=1 Tax=Geodermatophilus sp. CPCC 205761 TaxID=2936597 RepID=UPI003EEEEBF3
MYLVGATVCILVAAALQSRLLRLRGWDALLGTAVLAVTNVVVLSFGLAALSAYAAGPLTAASAGAAVVSLAANVALGDPEPWRGERTWSWRRPRTALEWVTASMVLLVAGHLVVRAVLAVRLAPFGYDALGYHLPAVGWLVQDGRLPGPETGIWVSGYPLGGELLAAWPAVLLHDDVLSRGVQVLSAVLGGTATIGLARAVGAARVPSVLAGCLFLMTPALLAQTMTAYVDVTAASLSLAGVCFLVRWARDPWDGHGRLVVAGLATGLAVGTKHIAVLGAVASLVAVTVVALRQERTRVLPVTAMFFVPAFIAGGGWYVENLLVTGNPVYPVAVAGLPGAVEPGRFSTSPPGTSLEGLMAVPYSWAHDLLPRSGISYEHRTGGLGSLFLWIGLPCLVAVTIAAIRHRDRLWALLLGVVVVPFLVQPFPWWARFTLPLAALAAVAVAKVLTPGSAGPEPAHARHRWAAVVLGGVVVLVLAMQPTLLVRTVTPTNGSNPVAAWQAFTVPPGERLDNGPTGGLPADSLAGVRRVRVAIDEVGIVGALFGPHFEREVLPVAAHDLASVARALEDADALVACRTSMIGRWAALDPAHLRLVTEPDAELAVWRVQGRPSLPDGLQPATGGADVYCT